MKELLIIDNYDSFTRLIAYSLQLVCSNPVRVIRNDSLSCADLVDLRPAGVIISPGPGSPLCPRDVGISAAAVRYWHGRVPLLGICLGHQLLCAIHGGEVYRTDPICHGIVHEIMVDQTDPLFAGVGEDSFSAMRYHSLAIDTERMSPPWRVTARTRSGVVMAVSDGLNSFGVQFHPESIATEHGAMILKNFARRCHV